MHILNITPAKTIHGIECGQQGEVPEAVGKHACKRGWAVKVEEAQQVPLRHEADEADEEQE